MYHNQHIAIAIPCYRVEHHIAAVVGTLPEWVDSIILVDDHSDDGTLATLQQLAAQDNRIEVIAHAQNIGVGGAMKTAYSRAIEEGSDVVVKMDGDGQMDAAYLPRLLDVLEEGDFAKGNRMFDRRMLGQMPWLRRIGNHAIAFMVKGASGYWNVSDPVNGYFAIRTSILRQLDFSRLANRYFFESSMLIEIHYAGARLREVVMPAIYAEEKSNLSIGNTLFSFPPKLLSAWLRRLHLSYFVYDFNICSLYLLVGLPSFLFGLIFGICKWSFYASHAMPAPTGTIMVAVLTFVLGFQMLLAAAQYDITAPNPFLRHEDC